MHPLVLFLASAPFIFLAWASAYPLAAAKLVTHWKRSWRRYLVNRYGTIAFNHLAQQLHDRAQKDGAPRKMVEKLLNDNKARIVQEFGTREAIAQIGEPSKFERFF